MILKSFSSSSTSVFSSSLSLLLSDVACTALGVSITGGRQFWGIGLDVGLGGSGSSVGEGRGVR